MTATQSILTSKLIVFAVVAGLSTIGGSADAQQGGQIAPNLVPLTPRLGVYLVQDFRGVRVASVIPGSVAQQIGLEPGDIITSVGFERAATNPVFFGNQLQRHIQQNPTVRLGVIDVRTGRLHYRHPYFGGPVLQFQGR